MQLVRKILDSVGLLEKMREAKFSYLTKTMTPLDQKMKGFYGQFLKNGDLCFDIGANRGNRSKVFLALRSKVIGFEPQPHCGDFLLKHYGQNPNFTLERIALGEEEGSGKLFISEQDTLSTLSQEWKTKQKESGRFTDIPWREEVEVPIKTFDQMIEKYGTPQFAKIDVEGFELDVLKGLSHSIPFISFEYAPELYDSVVECVNLLDSKFNSKFNFSSYETMEWEFNDWKDAATLIEHLAKHKDSIEYFGDIYVSNSH